MSEMIYYEEFQITLSETGVAICSISSPIPKLENMKHHFFDMFENEINDCIEMKNLKEFDLELEQDIGQIGQDL